MLRDHVATLRVSTHLGPWHHLGLFPRYAAHCDVCLGFVDMSVGQTLNPTPCGVGPRHCLCGWQKNAAVGSGFLMPAVNLGLLPNAFFMLGHYNS